jgi:hypothetical protein
MLVPSYETTCDHIPEDNALNLLVAVFLRINYFAAVIQYHVVTCLLVVFAHYVCSVRTYSMFNFLSFQFLVVILFLSVKLPSSINEVGLLQSLV